jgi:glycosyl transferase family 25
MIPCLVINMEKDVERLDNIKKQLKDFTRISAIEGLNDDPTEKDGQIETTVMCKMFCTNAMIGIMRSHIKCWRYIVENDLEYAIILEDDAIISKDLQEETISLLKSTTVSWDIILLGCFLCEYSDNDTITKVLMNMMAPFKSEEKINDLLFRPASWGGAHGYLVTRESCKKLLGLFSKASYHVDYKLLHSDLSILASSKQLISQNTSGIGSYNSSEAGYFSDYKIDKSRMSMEFMLNMPAGEIFGYKVTIKTVLIILIITITLFIYYKIARLQEVIYV